MVRVTALSNEYKDNLLSQINKSEGEQKATELEQVINNLKETEEVLVCIDIDTDKVIGYSKTTAMTHGILSLDYIYVLPSFRRDTNGSIILVAVYNRAVNRMVAGIIAQCQEDNQEGNAFLKARGFIIGKTEEGVNFYTKSLMHMYIPHKHED